MSTKVITMEPHENIPAGSVFNAKLNEQTHMWEGYWGSMWCSTFISVPIEKCEVHDRTKHDLFCMVEQMFKTRDENDRLSAEQQAEEDALRVLIDKMHRRYDDGE